MNTLEKLIPWRATREVSRISPFREAERMMCDMDRWMETFFNDELSISRRSVPGGWRSFPSIDMYEEKNQHIVKAEIPGIDKDDIHVSVVDNKLLIRGECKREETAREQDYFYSERYFGGISREIPLQSTVKANEIKASFKNGILRLEIPKAEEALEKEIKIEVG